MPTGRLFCQSGVSSLPALFAYSRLCNAAAGSHALSLFHSALSLDLTSGLLWLLQILGRMPKHMVKAANRAAQKMFHHRTSELLWPGELPSCTRVHQHLQLGSKV